jgi:hypothetical protein
MAILKLFSIYFFYMQKNINKIDSISLPILIMLFWCHSLLIYLIKWLYFFHVNDTNRTALLVFKSVIWMNQSNASILDWAPLWNFIDWITFTTYIIKLNNVDFPTTLMNQSNASILDWAPVWNFIDWIMFIACFIKFNNTNNRNICGKILYHIISYHLWENYCHLICVTLMRCEEHLFEHCLL